jgi:L-lactate dehydrogenase complex protein LldG
VSDARTEILRRIAEAVDPGRVPQSVERAYRLTGALGVDECVERFCSRVGEYRAHVHRVAEADIADVISSVCRAEDASNLVVPAGVPAAWRGSGIEFVDDHELSPGDLDQIDGALTGCTAAVAETGTIMLSGGPLDGRRALSLVPDLHVCVVREGQIAELLPEALTMIAAQGLERQPITLISGPSATSDIELSRVEGVHGPRRLVVLVAKEAQ